MRNKEFLLAIVAIVMFVMGVVMFVAAQWFGSFISVKLASWGAGICLTLAIFALTAKVWVSQRHSTFCLDDISFCSAFTLAQGGCMGLVLLIMMAFGLQMPAELSYAMEHPTCGTMFLGFLGMGFFFILHCINSASRKDFWLALQAGSAATLLISLAIGAGGMFYIIPVSMETSDTCIMITLGSMAVSLLSVVVQGFLAKKHN